VLSAQATTAVDVCHAKADVSVTVGPFGESPGLRLETSSAAEKQCSEAKAFLERATTIMNWSEAQVLAVIDHFENLGPDLVLCRQMAAEFPDFSPPLNCAGEPVASARRIVDRLREQYLTAASDAIGRAGAYASALAGIDSVSTTNVVFFDKQLEVLGAEANFPIGPFVVTVGGSVEARLSVTGSPRLDLASPPGGEATIGAGFTVTPSASVTATAIIGVGFVVVTVGVEGRVHLISIDVPVTTKVAVHSRPTEDPRVPANDGYTNELLSNQPGFSLLKPQRYGWDSAWSLDGNLEIGSFLSGELNGFVRIKFVFFSKTFRRKIASWKGIPPQELGLEPVIPLFALESPLPFSGVVPPILTAPRFAYVNPPTGSAIAIAPSPPPPPPPSSDGGVVLEPPSPVAVRNLNGLVEDTTTSLCVITGVPK
jgi:hypothetical protein